MKTLIYAFTATISGPVQGVMFRDFVQRKASLLHVCGEVRNVPDGTVYVYAEGSEDALKKRPALLKRGSLFARVHAVVATWGPPSGAFKNFSINYS